MSVVIETIESAALRGNRLGDPTARRTPIYLPPSYERERERRYPTIVCLAGFTGSGLSWLNVAPWDPALPERMDALIASGAAAEAILVLPDCMTRFGGSEYVDSPATGRYFTHVADEVVPFVDARYRTLATREHRGVMGKSSGGIGALRFAMRRPDLFAACASHSGDMLFDVCYRPAFVQFCESVERFGGADAFLDAFARMRPRPPDAVSLMNMIAMCAAYSPSDHPRGFDLPFDPWTGEVRPDVFDRWLSHDPVRMVAAHVEALRGLGDLWFDCGRRDEYHLHLGARALSRALAAAGVPYTYDEFDGTHRDIQFRYDVSLARMSRVLS